MIIFNGIEIKRLLLIRLSSMGDIILTSALIRILSEQLNDSKIDFLLAKPFSDIYAENPRINEIIIYDKSKSLKEISKQKLELIGKYDAVIDLQNNLRSKHFRKNLSKNIFQIKKNRFNKLSLVFFKKPFKSTTTHIAEVYFNSAKPLGIKDDNKGLELWLREEKGLKYYPPERKIEVYNNRKINIENGNAEKVNLKIQNPKIAIAPGAHHFTKRWQQEKFLALIHKLKKDLNADIFLIGGTPDKEITDFILKKSDVEINNYSCSGSILETAEIIDKCDILVTNDTGVMHIASARQTPIIAIFGSTVLDFGFAPYRVPNIVIEKDLPCRPCTHIGRGSCPKKHFNCMNLISVQEVFEAVNQLLLL